MQLALSSQPKAPCDLAEEGSRLNQSDQTHPHHCIAALRDSSITTLIPVANSNTADSAQLQRWKTACEAAQARCRQLEADLACEQEQLHAAGDALNMAKQESALLRQHLSSTSEPNDTQQAVSSRTALSKAQSEADMLREQLASCQHDLNSTKAELEGSVRQRVAAETQAALARGRAVVLEKSLSDAEEAAGHRDAQVTAAQAKVDSALQSRTQHELRELGLRREMEQLQYDNETLEHQLAAAKANAKAEREIAMKFLQARSLQGADQVQQVCPALLFQMHLTHAEMPALRRPLSRRSMSLRAVMSSLLHMHMFSLMALHGRYSLSLLHSTHLTPQTCNRTQARKQPNARPSS